MFLKDKKYILDGGTGQTLIEKGLKPKGTLWSATALINNDYHNLLVETHLDFINAGAELIVTNNFCVRKRGFLQNNVLEHFESANRIAGQLAQRAKDLSNAQVLIAGSLPTRGDTYKSSFFQTETEIYQEFYETAKTLNPFIDLFFLDVICSVKETKIALEAVKQFKKPILIGLHFKNNARLPSGELIEDVIKEIHNYNYCGIIAACVSPEIARVVLPEFKMQKFPYGFKVNAFKNIPDDYLIDEQSGQQPTSILGTRKDLTPGVFKKLVDDFVKQGANLLGGCCEIKPRHIQSIKNLI